MWHLVPYHRPSSSPTDTPQTRWLVLNRKMYRSIAIYFTHRQMPWHDRLNLILMLLGNHNYCNEMKLYRWCDFLDYVRAGRTSREKRCCKLNIGKLLLHVDPFCVDCILFRLTFHSHILHKSILQHLPIPCIYHLPFLVYMNFSSSKYFHVRSHLLLCQWKHDIFH